jgi:c(7)-type cytochrome triheme protein
LRCHGRGITRGAHVYALAVLLSLPSVAAAATFPGADSSRAGAPISVKLPADLVYDRVAGPERVVIFSHETHFAFEGNRCTGCHPRLFRMLRPSHRTSHAEMNAVRACGACHDGHHAFGVEDSSTCGTCHSGRKNDIPAAAGAPGTGAAASVGPRVPKPHAYPPGESSPGRVTFKHETHLRGGAGCVTCHPKLFGMKLTPPKPEAGMHALSSCGACHDGKQVFGTEDPATCARCHSGPGARP